MSSKHFQLRIVPALLAGAVVTVATATLAQQVRDPAAGSPTGTAVISGTVTDDSPSHSPLRRAVVTASGGDMVLPRSTITDDAGQYSIRGLSAGRVNVSAIKNGYVPGAFGATRPGRPGTPVELRNGETVRADVRLARGGVLAGAIRDGRGDPVRGVRVFAVSGLKPAALSPVGTPINQYTTTDERGAYRLYGLTPGPYVVAAVMTDRVTAEIDRRSTDEVEALLGRLRARAGTPGLSSASAPFPSPSETGALAPVFFPGTTSLRSAARVVLAAGDVRDGLDFTMSTIRVATIEGTVVGNQGAPIELSIVANDALRFFALAGATPVLVQKPGADGHFKYSTIPPGHYEIWARAATSLPGDSGRGRGAPAGQVMGDVTFRNAVAQTLYAVTEVEVLGQSVEGVTLQLQRGSGISGKVFVDASTDVAPDLSRVRVLAGMSGASDYSVLGATRMGNFGQTVPIQAGAGGDFEIASLPPGDYRLRLTPPPPADASGKQWWFRSAMLDGRDLLDTGVTITAERDLTGVVITLTDRPSEISGTLESATGVAAPEYYVVALSVDRTTWIAGSRRLKFTRPSTSGAFSFLNLPPGDYLIAAVTDLDPETWHTPEFLSSLAAAGVKVTLGLNEHVTQNLQIR